MQSQNVCWEEIQGNREFKIITDLKLFCYLERIDNITTFRRDFQALYVNGIRKLIDIA